MNENDQSDKIRRYFSGKSPFSLGVWDLCDFIIGNINKLLQVTMQDYLKITATNLMYTEVRGVPAYLQSLAAFLSTTYNETVQSSNLFPTYSATHGLKLLISHFLEKGDYIFMEELTYVGAVDEADEYGLKICSISLDADGMKLDELEKQLVLCKKDSKHVQSEKKPFWAIVYVMTTLHNPVGFCYSEDCCKNIVALARKYNVLVVADEVYQFWRYNIPIDDSALKRLLCYDDQGMCGNGTGHVVCNGSLSKVLFPSLRLGWIESSPWVIKQIAAKADVFHGGGYNGFNQGLAAVILKHPLFKAFLKEAGDYYKNLLKITVDYLKVNLPKEITFHEPMGGFLLWIAMPLSCSSVVLNKKLEKYGIQIGAGSRYTSGKTHDNYFRLCFSNYEEEDLLLAMKVLCKELKTLLEETKVIL